MYLKNTVWIFDSVMKFVLFITILFSFTLSSYSALIWPFILLCILICCHTVTIKPHCPVYKMKPATMPEHPAMSISINIDWRFYFCSSCICAYPTTTLTCSQYHEMRQKNLYLYCICNKYLWYWDMILIFCSYLSYLLLTRWFCMLWVACGLEWDFGHNLLVVKVWWLKNTWNSGTDWDFALDYTSTHTYTHTETKQRLREHLSSHIRMNTSICWGQNNIGLGSG